ASALEYPAPAAPGLADVVRSPRRSAPAAVVRAVPGPGAAERAHGHGADGQQSIPRQTAPVRARKVLRLHLFRRGRQGARTVVEPAPARPVLPGSEPQGVKRIRAGVEANRGDLF